MELHVLRGADGFARAADCPERLGYERAVGDTVRGGDEWTLPGYCEACEAGVLPATGRTRTV